MVLIYGEHNSGKSSKALSLAKKHSPNVLYLSLDNDQSVKIIAEKNNIEWKYIKNCFLIDIEFSILGRSFDTIVIDGLNFIQLVENISHEFNLRHIIKSLEYLHHTYDVQIIATFNTLRCVDRMKPSVVSIFSDKKDWSLIETEFKKVKQQVL